MREDFVQSMAKQVEAQTHEESKFWRASQPLPNQSSMQGRESEKKSNIQQFRMVVQNFRKACEIFRKACEIFHKACEIPKGVQVARQRARLWKMNFAPCAKFRKLGENPPV